MNPPTHLPHGAGRRPTHLTPTLRAHLPTFRRALRAHPPTHLPTALRADLPTYLSSALRAGGRCPPTYRPTHLPTFTHFTRFT